jgi:hypothetical protein
VGTSPRPSFLIHPSFSRPGGAESPARAQETLILGDSAGQEARHACSEWLRLQRLKRRVEDDLELMCSWVAYAVKLSSIALSLADWSVGYLPWVSFFS